MSQDFTRFKSMIVKQTPGGHVVAVAVAVNRVPGDNRMTQEKSEWDYKKDEVFFHGLYPS